MLKKMLLPGILLSCCVMLSACATTKPPAQQDKEATQIEEKVVVKETMVAEEKTTNPCDALLDEAVQESRKTMKSVHRSCEGVTMEATPVWSLDYKGAVHIRTYDANGGKLRDEIIN